MRLLPSRTLKKHLKAVTNDNDYLKDMEKRREYLKSIVSAMESPFGVILVNALESIEGDALENLYVAGNAMVARQAKAEIKISRYLKAVLMGYVHEKEAFDAAMKTYADMEQGEQSIYD